MSQRFFVESLIASDTARLTGAEAQHASKVMRLRPGDVVTLFDGSGAEFDARITDIDRTSVTCHIEKSHAIDRELPRTLVLGVALPKGDRQRWLIEKVVELGAASLVPLVTERSVAIPTPKALERLRRTVIESSKQCGRNRLMAIQSPARWPQWLDSPTPAAGRFLADPSGTTSFAQSSHRASGHEVYWAVGPEGGFTAAEILLARQAGWTPVSLGQRILRVETAACAIVAGEGG